VGGPGEDVQRGLMRPVALLMSLLLVGIADAQVVASGAMRRTMWEGRRAGIIAMDSLVRPGQYGMGPLDHLRGEITLINGHCHVARFVGDSLVVTEDSTAKAPFFVHGRVNGWMDVPLPVPVKEDKALEAVVGALDRSEPFFFVLDGRFDSVEMHVWDLPSDSTFTGPEEGARFKRRMSLHDIDGQVVGVFSRKHRTVFTHHDSDVHLHFLSADGRVMGHVDHLAFGAPALRLMVEVP